LLVKKKTHKVPCASTSIVFTNAHHNIYNPANHNFSPQTHSSTH